MLEFKKTACFYFILFKNYFKYLSPLSFHVNFRIILSTHISCWDFDKNYVNPIEPYLGDIADLLWGHHNTVNIAIKQATLLFLFPCAYKSDIYTTLQSINSVVALCLRNAHTLFKKYCIAKKC